MSELRQSLPSLTKRYPTLKVDLPNHMSTYRVHVSGAFGRRPNDRVPMPSVAVMREAAGRPTLVDYGSHEAAVVVPVGTPCISIELRDATEDSEIVLTLTCGGI